MAPRERQKLFHFLHTSDGKQILMFMFIYVIFHRDDGEYQFFFLEEFDAVMSTACEKLHHFSQYFLHINQVAFNSKMQKFGKVPS